MRRRRASAALLAGVVDVAAIAVFVAIGRSAHGHVVDLAGIASTAWPFLAGAATGWLVARAWRRPTAAAPAVVIWFSCVGVGMVLRVVAGQGTAAAFIGVAAGFLGLELFGWRLLGALARRRRTNP